MDSNAECSSDFVISDDEDATISPVNEPFHTSDEEVSESDEESIQKPKRKENKQFVISSDEDSETSVVYSDYEEKFHLLQKPSTSSTSAEFTLKKSVTELCSDSDDEEVSISLNETNILNIKQNDSDTDNDKSPSVPRELLKIETKRNVLIRPITADRKKELEFEINKLETLRDSQMIQYKNIMKSTILASKLPDKGEKLKISLTKLTSDIERTNEELAYQKKVLKQCPCITEPIVIDGMLSHLPNKNVNVFDMGKKAYQTYNAQKTVTLETLQTINNSLKTIPEGAIEPDPAGLKNIKLLMHQKQGLAWLLWRETQTPPGGILADDMGLGKTLQMISLMLKSKNLPKKNDEAKSEFFNSNLPKGGTLIISPSSVMSQWKNEFDTKVSRGNFNIYVHHGFKREKNARRLAKFDVVITSYTILQKDYNESGPVGPLLAVDWDRIILDEAHTIRNFKTITAKAAFSLKGKNKWALTGTPIHNKQLDFYSLIKFIDCKPFDDLNVWKTWVDNKDMAGLRRLNCVTKAILLRRTKKEIMSENNSLALKEKTLNIIPINLDREEEAVYEKVALFSKTILGQFIQQRADKENLLEFGITVNRKNLHGVENPFKDHPQLKRLFNKMQTMKDIQTHQILVLLLRLRQMCCHPSLINSMLDRNDIDEIEDDQGNDLELIDRMVRMSLTETDNDVNDQLYFGNLTENNPVFDAKRLNNKIKSVIKCIHENVKDDKAIVVSQWTSFLDIVGTFLKKDGIKFSSLTGKVSIPNRAKVINDFNSPNQEPKILLLSLNAGGVGLNLIGANHLLLIDNHWNPQLELQASDRIYRVGQTKNVFIYRFITVNTIEERVQFIQENKLEIANDIVSGTSVNKNKLTTKDFITLFNFDENNQAKR